MKRLPAALVASAGLLALAACSDATGVGSPSATNVNVAPSYTKDITPAEASDGHFGVQVLKGNAYEAQANAGKQRVGGGTGIFYHGGPVLQAGTKVVAIYWAAGTIYNGGPGAGTSNTGGTSGDGSLVGTFLRGLGGTPYFGINSTYTDGSGRAIANSVSYTGYWANNTSAPSGTTSISDAQMIAMLQSGFNSGALSYDASTLYLIFTSGKVNLGGGFGSQYCGYHTHGTVTVGGGAKTALYAAMPYDYAYPGSCTNGSAPANGSYDPGADGEVSVLGHEIEETTTDMMGNAWYDTRGAENADKCAWTFGTTYTTGAGGVANMKVGGTDFLVQRNWKNSGAGGCFLS